MWSSSARQVARRAVASAAPFHSSAARATTIVSVRKGGDVALVGDGQVSLGATVLKGNARKVRRLGKAGEVVAGFAGSTSDALALMERLEMKLEQYPDQLSRACIELSKLWRTDKYLRRLDAVLIVANKDNTYELTGNGDVIEMTSDENGNSAMAVGSGGAYALAAARAFLSLPDTGMTAQEVGEKSIAIAADICVYTNHTTVIETIPKAEDEVDAGEE
jgi:ATP-dependent HslUV protease subunit HslV